MNVKIMLGLTVVITSAVVANGAVEPQRYYTYAQWSSVDYAKLDKDIWTNSAGEVVSAPTDGSAICVVNDGGKSYEPTWNADCNLHGLEIELPATESSAKGRTSWYFNGNANQILVGEGGIDVRRGSFSLRRPNDNAGTLKLTANQTWTGGLRDEKAQLAVGGTRSPVGSRLVAATGVDKLTIAGGLNVCLFSPNNKLTGVDVTVCDTAKLHLIDMIDARLGARSLTLSGPGTHMTFGSPVPSRIYNYQWTGSMDYSIAYAPTNIVAIDHEHLSQTVVLENGAGFSSVGGIYGLDNLHIRGTGTSVISGDLTFTQTINCVTFETEGVKLSLDTVNRLSGVSSSGFVVDGPGILEIADSQAFTDGFVLENGARVVLKESGLVPVITGDGTVEIAAGAVVYLKSANIADFTGTIIVSGGTLALDEVLQGRVTVTSGEVVYGTDPFVVTDVVRTEEVMKVAEGQTLRVFGSGLTAATELELEAATLRFECSAVVSSPVRATKDTVRLETASENVVGELAGYFTSAIPSAGRETNTEITGTGVYGEGCLKLTGGGEWNNYRPNSFYSFGGTVWFADGSYKFRNAHCGMKCVTQNTGPYGKLWLVTGNAKLHVSGYNANYAADLIVAGLNCNWNNEIESVLEVRDGGEVELAAYGTLLLGYLQSSGRVKIGQDGKVRVTDGNGHVRLGNSTVTTGIVQLERGGLLETAAPLLHGIQDRDENYQPQGRFMWNGGKVKLLQGFPMDEAALFRNRTTTSWDSVNNSLRVWVKIMGEDCTLDLTDLPDRETPLANVPAGLERSEWFGTGTLTVKGGKSFVFQSFPDGINLKIEGAGTQVILPTNVEIHDYATCLVNEKVNAGKLHYTTLDQCLQNLALASFTAEGAAGSFVCLKPDCKVTIAEACAAEGGEFVNGMLSAVGGLEVGDLTFAENAIVCGDPAAAAFAVTGDITLPDVLRYAVRKTKGYPTTFTAFTAGGALIGNPTTLTPEPGMNSRQVVIDPAAKSVGFSANGLMLLVR